MKKKIIGGLAKSAPPLDLFTDGNTPYYYLDGALGGDITPDPSVLGRGGRIRMRLTAKVAGITGTFSFVLGSSPSITLPTTTPTNGFIFLELEFFSLGYIPPGSIWPGTSEVYYVGTYIGGDGAVQQITGLLGSMLNDLHISDITPTPSPTGPNQMIFSLGEFTYEEVEA